MVTVLMIDRLGNREPYEGIGSPLKKLYLTSVKLLCYQKKLLEMLNRFAKKSK